MIPYRVLKVVCLGVAYLSDLEILFKNICFFHGKYSASNYMVKVNNRNTRARCEIYSKLTMKTPERSSVSILNFEQVNAGWIVAFCTSDI